MKNKLLIPFVAAVIQLGLAQTLTVRASEGNGNIQVLCTNRFTSCSGALVWIIADSVFGLLNLPHEFSVCSLEHHCHLDYLIIPVVRRIFDGYTFQCASIDYNANTEHLGIRTELSVVPMPTIFQVVINRTINHDVLELDYTQLRIGAENSSIALAWRYSSLTCQPSLFTVEGYTDRDALGSNAPTLVLNSTSTELSLPTSTLHLHSNNGSLYIRLLAYEESGSSCARESAVLYYKVDTNDGDSSPLYASHEAVACIQIPVNGSMSSESDYSSLEVVWPEEGPGGRLCYCPPYEGSLRLFSRCISTTSCNTSYFIAVRNNSVCFSELYGSRENIPVYFSMLEFCPNYNYAIRSVVASFTIVLTPPSPPQTFYNESCFCFWSHPSSFVETYIVNGTDSSRGVTVFSGIYASPQCLKISLALYPNLCESLTIVVVGINRVGRASVTDYIAIAIDNSSTCIQDHTENNINHILAFQYRLYGTFNCTNQLLLHKMAMELVVFINGRCNCTFPSTLITRAHFTCPPSQPSPPHPQHVTYRASITTKGQLNRSMLEAVLREWPALHRAILLQGELLSVDHTCPVIISSFQEEECEPIAQSNCVTEDKSNLSVMTSVMPAVVVIMMASVFIAMLSVCNLKYRRVLKKLKLQHESTRLEGVNPALPLSVTSHNHAGTSGPQYEEIQELREAKMASHSITVENNTLGDSYEITKCPAYAAAGEL